MRWSSLSDDATMTATIRCAVDHADPADDLHELPEPSAEPTATDAFRTKLGQALLLHLRGEAESAALELGALDEADVARAIGVLTEVTATTWSDLEERAMYPISLVHVMTQLDAVGAQDLDVSAALLHHVAGSNAGARFPVEELITAAGPGSALYGAFDATVAMIRFAGRRWWRPTEDILTDLDLGDHDSTR